MKSKKILLGLGTLVTIVTPIAAVVSCGAATEGPNANSENGAAFHNRGFLPPEKILPFRKTYKFGDKNYKNIDNAKTAVDGLLKPIEHLGVDKKANDESALDVSKYVKTLGKPGLKTGDSTIGVPDEQISNDGYVFDGKSYPSFEAAKKALEVTDVVHHYDASEGKGVVSITLGSDTAKMPAITYASTPSKAQIIKDFNWVISSPTTGTAEAAAREARAVIRVRGAEVRWLAQTGQPLGMTNGYPEVSHSLVITNPGNLHSGTISPSSSDWDIKTHSMNLMGSQWDGYYKWDSPVGNIYIVGHNAYGSHEISRSQVSMSVTPATPYVPETRSTTYKLQYKGTDVGITRTVKGYPQEPSITESDVSLDETIVPVLDHDETTNVHKLDEISTLRHFTAASSYDGTDVNTLTQYTGNTRGYVYKDIFYATENELKDALVAGNIYEDTFTYDYESSEWSTMFKSKEDAYTTLIERVYTPSPQE